MIPQYMPRIVDGQLESRLRRPTAVVVKGPKYCGKTHTAEQVCASSLYLADKATKRYVETASGGGSRAYLEGEYLRLIDEWQVVRTPGTR